jgi:hypothetical protein
LFILDWLVATESRVATASSAGLLTTRLEPGYMLGRGYAAALAQAGASGQMQVLPEAELAAAPESEAGQDGRMASMGYRMFGRHQRPDGRQPWVDAGRAG